MYIQRNEGWTGSDCMNTSFSSCENERVKPASKDTEWRTNWDKSYGDVITILQCLSSAAKLEEQGRSVWEELSWGRSKCEHILSMRHRSAETDKRRPKLYIKKTKPPAAHRLECWRPKSFELAMDNKNHGTVWHRIIAGLKNQLKTNELEDFTYSSRAYPTQNR